MSEKPSYSHEAATLRPCLRIRGTKRTGLSGCQLGRVGSKSESRNGQLLPR